MQEEGDNRRGSEDGATTGPDGRGDSGVGVTQDAQALAAAVGRYRELVASLPGLVPEMVQGSTVEEVDASAARAREAYSALRRRVAEQYETLVPTANPARSAGSVGYNSLSPEAKIALGLRGRG